MKRTIVLLICLVFSAFISPPSRGEAIFEFGQIIYSKELSTYYFVFQREGLTYAYQIPVKSMADRNHLKSLLGQIIRVNGEVKLVRDHKDSFSAREQVTLKKVDQFDLKLLAFDMKKFLAREKYISHERSIDSPGTSAFISVSDSTTNTLITAGAVTLGILTGPMSLIPLGIFGITQF